MENLIEKQLLDAVVKLTEIVAESKEAATPKVESEVESEVQVKLEPLEEIEVHSVEEEEAKLQLDDEAGKLYVENKDAATPKVESEVESEVQVKLEPLKEIEAHSVEEEEAKLQLDDGKLYAEILIENKEIKTENEEESFESADDASTYSSPTSSRSRSRSRSSTPESSPMRPIITSPVPRRQPPPKVEELSETSESSMENEQEEEGDETFVKKEPDVEMMATEADDSETKLVIDENDETESKPDSNKKVDETKDEAHEMADAAGEIQEAANEISGNAENSENVAVANEESESEVQERLSLKRKMPDDLISDRFPKKKKMTSDMDTELFQKSKKLKNVFK
ncbi:uncharacterized protein LOC133849068 [Drosophila sulfurigaster albostrigata]|uniref:uncharacterized protein LOC133849068 n=1 Tax=Drosophila sulfurigaster albostrigata TaxID=89887 RepID=UPI002D21BA20|nr:uncharacterized protein LOC133849068 [Drosophila sulfurigaster albostrigata]XP_062140903.1 uncharacterized protein LOC133849068 [Drosophila sulfurigaster albostrigata]XP_062140904.1 uncharacterized protein LOC133849068 [Drosophila sulfurigaster albostrigata]